MAGILEKLKLVQVFEAELNMTPEEFRQQMNEKIDGEELGFFSDSFDAWRSHKNPFKGVVNADRVTFKYRQGFFNYLSSLPVAYASFRPDRKNLQVKTKINALKGPMPVIVVVLLLATISVVASAIVSVNAYNIGLMNIAIPILVFSLMLLFPYLIMRTAVNALKKKIDSGLYNTEAKTTFTN